MLCATPTNLPRHWIITIAYYTWFRCQTHTIYTSPRHAVYSEFLFDSWFARPSTSSSWFSLIHSTFACGAIGCPQQQLLCGCFATPNFPRPIDTAFSSPLTKAFPIPINIHIYIYTHEKVYADPKKLCVGGENSCRIYTKPGRVKQLRNIDLLAARLFGGQDDVKWSWNSLRMTRRL